MRIAIYYSNKLAYSYISILIILTEPWLAFSRTLIFLVFLIVLTGTYCAILTGMPPKRHPPNDSSNTSLPSVCARDTQCYRVPAIFPIASLHVLPSIPLCSHFIFYPSLRLVSYLMRHQNSSQQRTITITK